MVDTTFGPLAVSGRTIACIDPETGSESWHRGLQDTVWGVVELANARLLVLTGPALDRCLALEFSGHDGGLNGVHQALNASVIVPIGDGFYANCESQSQSMQYRELGIESARDPIVSWTVTRGVATIGGVGALVGRERKGNLAYAMIAGVKARDSSPAWTYALPAFAEVSDVFIGARGVIAVVDGHRAFQDLHYFPVAANAAGEPTVFPVARTILGVQCDDTHAYIAGSYWDPIRRKSDVSPPVDWNLRSYRLVDGEVCWQTPVLNSPDEAYDRVDVRMTEGVVWVVGGYESHDGKPRGVTICACACADGKSVEPVTRTSSREADDDPVDGEVLAVEGVLIVSSTAWMCAYRIADDD